MAIDRPPARRVLAARGGAGSSPRSPRDPGSPPPTLAPVRGARRGSGGRGGRQRRATRPWGSLRAGGGGRPRGGPRGPPPPQFKRARPAVLGVRRDPALRETGAQLHGGLDRHRPPTAVRSLFTL